MHLPHGFGLSQILRTIFFDFRCSKLLVVNASYLQVWPTSKKMTLSEEFAGKTVPLREVRSSFGLWLKLPRSPVLPGLFWKESGTGRETEWERERGRSFRKRLKQKSSPKCLKFTREKMLREVPWPYVTKGKQTKQTHKQTREFSLNWEIPRWRQPVVHIVNANAETRPFAVRFSVSLGHRQTICLRSAISTKFALVCWRWTGIYRNGQASFLKQKLPLCTFAVHKLFTRHKLCIQRARSFEILSLAAAGPFFGHMLNQNVRSLPFYGDYSPFLPPKIKHFFFFPKKWKVNSVEEVIGLSEDSIWLPSYGPHSSPFSHLHDQQNSVLCHCQSTEILVQAMNIPIVSWFSTEKQARAKKNEKRNLDIQGLTFLESTKTEQVQFKSLHQNQPKFTLLIQQTAGPLRKAANFFVRRSPSFSARRAHSHQQRLELFFCHCRIHWACVELFKKLPRGFFLCQTVENKCVDGLFFFAPTTCRFTSFRHLLQPWFGWLKCPSSIQAIAGSDLGGGICFCVRCSFAVLFFFLKRFFQSEFLWLSFAVILFEE